MWATLFIIVIMASIGFALAAAVSAQTLAARCRDLSRIACARYEAKWPRTGEAPVRAREAQPIDAASVALTEPALLPRRMRSLQIDLDESLLHGTTALSRIGESLPALS